MEDAPDDQALQGLQQCEAALTELEQALPQLLHARADAARGLVRGALGYPSPFHSAPRAHVHSRRHWGGGAGSQLAEPLDSARLHVTLAHAAVALYSRAPPPSTSAHPTDAVPSA